MIDWILANPSEAALTVLATTTAAAMAIRVLIPALSAIAAKTTTKADDEAVTRLASGLDWLIVALDAARRVLPRVVIGPLPSNQPIAKAGTSMASMKPVSMAPPGPEVIQPVRFIGDERGPLLERPIAPPPSPKGPGN
jgi:hypothetical protein